MSVIVSTEQLPKIEMLEENLPAAELLAEDSKITRE